MTEDEAREVKVGDMLKLSSDQRLFIVTRVTMQGADAPYFSGATAAPVSWKRCELAPYS